MPGMGALGVAIGQPLADLGLRFPAGLEYPDANHSYFCESHSSSIMRLSIQQPRPSIDIFTLASVRTCVKSSEVN